MLSEKDAHIIDLIAFGYLRILFLLGKYELEEYKKNHLYFSIGCYSSETWK